MDTTGTDPKIIYIEIPKSLVSGIKDYDKTFVFEGNIPFTTETYNVKILPIDDSDSNEEFIECVKHSQDNLLDEQKRFLKEREKRNFRKMCKGRR